MIGDMYDNSAQTLNDLYVQRYAWLRKNPAFDSEATLGAMTPEEFDYAVDQAMMPWALTDIGKRMLKAAK